MGRTVLKRGDRRKTGREDGIFRLEPLVLQKPPDMVEIGGEYKAENKVNWMLIRITATYLLKLLMDEKLSYPGSGFNVRVSG